MSLDIIKASALAFEVPYTEILKQNRTGGVANARILAMYLTRETTKTSYPKIGKLFEREHATVMSAIAKVEKEKEFFTPYINQALKYLKYSPMKVQRLMDEKISELEAKVERLEKLILEREKKQIKKEVEEQKLELIDVEGVIEKQFEDLMRKCIETKDYQMRSEICSEMFSQGKKMLSLNKDRGVYMTKTARGMGITIQKEYGIEFKV